MDLIVICSLAQYPLLLAPVMGLGARLGGLVGLSFLVTRSIYTVIQGGTGNWAFLGIQAVASLARGYQLEGSKNTQDRRVHYFGPEVNPLSIALRSDYTRAALRDIFLQGLILSGCYGLHRLTQASA